MPKGEKISRLKGEQDVTSLCKRFNIDATGIITPYREFFSDPQSNPSLVGERLLKALTQIDPVISAEAERGFSQMNLACQSRAAACMSVSHLSSWMFTSINGPPVQVWEAHSALQKWLEHNKSAENNQPEK